MSTLVAQTISNGTVSTSSANVIQGSAKAWVNYKGTATRGINGSYNVSSVTFNGTGDYTINFTNALTDANYAICINGDQAAAGSNPSYNLTKFGGTYSTTACQIVSIAGDRASLQDNGRICVSVFR